MKEQPQKNIYLNNKSLLAEVMESKRKGKMTDKLAKMLMLLTSRYAKKGNFANYSYNEDMVGYAMLMLVKTWDSFDPNKSDNPFAFFTQCIKNSFIQYLNQEKRQRNIRDELLVDVGMSPSHTYTNEHSEDRVLAHDEEDFFQHQRDAQSLKQPAQEETTDE